MKKQIAILGSTGSIGTQALEVIEEHSDLYEVYCLTANNRVKELAEQARKFKPAAVVIANESHYEELKSMLADCPDINVYAGKQALDDIVTAGPVDMVLTAMVGFAGLSPTIQAIKAHKKICLANKETLVVAGIGRRMSGTPSCAFTAPSANCTALCTMLCGCTSTCILSASTPNSHLASITSKPLFIIVALSMVIFAPMSQVG